MACRMACISKGAFSCVESEKMKLSLEVEIILLLGNRSEMVSSSIITAYSLKKGVARMDTITVCSIFSYLNCMLKMRAIFEEQTFSKPHAVSRSAVPLLLQTTKRSTQFLIPFLLYPRQKLIVQVSHNTWQALGFLKHF